MTAIARASRPLLTALVGVALLASLAATEASAATLSVRLEAGPHPAVTFSSTWQVTGRRTVTYAAPVTVSGSRRVNVPDRGWHLNVTSGALAGWWVKENRVSYVPGIVGTTTWSPVRHLAMGAGRWELYRFTSTGAMAQARGRTVSAATTTHVDRTSVIDGRRYVRIADGAWAGWWVPGSLASPNRITCSVGSPPTGTAGRKVSAVASATGEIALTFDMGGRLTPALDIVQFLELERVCATIFPTGAAAQTDIGRQVMAEIKAHPELFELGNHTVHHCNLRDGGGGAACPATRPSAAFVTGELQDADAIIAGLAGRHTTPYWRPPYGAVDSTLVGVAAAAGYPYTIMWSTDTIDWRTVANGGPTAAQIAAKVIANRKAGAIVLMHLGGYHTRQALPAVIHGLRGADYTPTSISALYR
jgi:peptidoglycan/xylan/chitin deacetylase (PgdA/CDA1 family)